MNKTKKKPSVKRYNIQKELAGVDELFRRLENDKSLPTFGEHFMFCLISGVSEHVNLKSLYPKTHKNLSTWLEKHNRKINASKKA